MHFHKKTENKKVTTANGYQTTLSCSGRTRLTALFYKTSDHTGHHPRHGLTKRAYGYCPKTKKASISGKNWPKNKFIQIPAKIHAFLEHPGQKSPLSSTRPRQSQEKQPKKVKIHRKYIIMPRYSDACLRQPIIVPDIPRDNHQRIID